MQTILISAGLLFAMVAVGVAALMLRDRITRTKPKHGRTWYVPPWHPNCRCTLLPWQSKAMEHLKKKMYKDAKNFLVQAQYGSPKSGRMFYNEIFNPPSLRKERKMKKGLEKVFVHTPNDLICAGVQEMMINAGLKWCSGDTKIEKTLAFPIDGCGYGADQCLSINGSRDIEHSSGTYYGEDSDFREVTIPELAKLLAKPVHTMMTAKELQGRLMVVDLNEETALVLGIEKWERLTKEENREELVANPEIYIQSDSCGLCELHQRTPGPGGNSCSGCSLVLIRRGSCGNVRHPWQEARQDILRGDYRGFLFHAKELITLMENALEELHKPKEYKLGQFFLLNDEDEDDLLVILGRTDVDHAALISVGEDEGNMWSGSVGKGEGSSSLYYTQNQIDEVSGDSEAIPVDVEITVVNKEKK